MADRRRLLDMAALALLLSLAIGLVAGHEYIGNAKGFTQVPTDIPQNTTILQLDSNDLANADFDLLDGLDLVELSLQANSFTTFPKLDKVGSTLMVLHLNDNELADIPSNDLSKLDELTEIYLENNQFTAVPDFHYVDGTLQVLNMRNNDLQTADHLKDLDRLVVLNVGRNTNLDLTEQNLRDIDSLEVLYYDRCPHVPIEDLTRHLNLQMVNIGNNHLAQIPTMPTPCILRWLNAIDNDLTSVESAIGHCAGIEFLELAGNRLTTFPDVSASGAVLQTLHLSNNQIAFVDPAITRSLVALEELTLDNNALTTFPDFTASSATLSTLTLYSNRLSSLEPDLLTPLIHLTSLDLHDNRFTSLPDVRQLPRLQHLLLSHNPLTHAPPPRHVVALGNLLTLDLRNTSLVHLPSLCPRAALSLQLENNSALELCSSSMAWLKQSFFSLTVTDVLCPQLGKMWSQASFAELVATPRTYQPGDVKQMFLGGSLPGTFCPWPSKGILTPGSLAECFMECLEDDACTGFNYHRARALCAIVAPSLAQETPFMDDDEGWELFVQ